MRSRKATTTNGPCIGMAMDFSWFPQWGKASIRAGGGRIRVHRRFVAPGLNCLFSTHAYHSWKRGRNENTNGLIRAYFPKGTDFSKLPTKEVKRGETRRNNRPKNDLPTKFPMTSSAHPLARCRLGPPTEL